MTTNPITIRPVTKPDLPDILEMAQALAAHHGDTPALTTETLKRDILTAPTWATALVANADQPVGYAVLCPLIQLQWGVRGMEMHHLFVIPNWRARGIATRLIKASIKTANRMGCAYMTVGTHPDNDTAQRLYRNTGFTLLPNRGPQFSIGIED